MDSGVWVSTAFRSRGYGAWNFTAGETGVRRGRTCSRLGYTRFLCFVRFRSRKAHFQPYKVANDVGTFTSALFTNVLLLVAYVTAFVVAIFAFGNTAFSQKKRVFKGRLACADSGSNVPAAPDHFPFANGT